MNYEDVRRKKERVEQEYDALITKMNRCQAQLSNKAAQVQKLNPDDYRKWLADKKQEQADIQAEVAKKKAERAEARRQFNSWEPAYKEEWLEWPDCEGWWWFYGISRPYDDMGFSIYFFTEDDEGELLPAMGDAEVDDELANRKWNGKWKFQEEPEEPQ